MRRIRVEAGLVAWGLVVGCSDRALTDPIDSGDQESTTTEAVDDGFLSDSATTSESPAPPQCEFPPARDGLVSVIPLDVPKCDAQADPLINERPGGGYLVTGYECRWGTYHRRSVRAFACDGTVEWSWMSGEEYGEVADFEVRADESIVVLYNHGVLDSTLYEVSPQGETMQSLDVGFPATLLALLPSGDAVLIGKVDERVEVERRDPDGLVVSRRTWPESELFSAMAVETDDRGDLWVQGDVFVAGRSMVVAKLAPDLSSRFGPATGYGEHLPVPSITPIGEGRALMLSAADGEALDILTIGPDGEISSRVSPPEGMSFVVPVASDAGFAEDGQPNAWSSSDDSRLAYIEGPTVARLPDLVDCEFSRWYGNFEVSRFERRVALTARCDRKSDYRLVVATLESG